MNSSYSGWRLSQLTLISLATQLTKMTFFFMLFRREGECEVKESSFRANNLVTDKVRVISSHEKGKKKEEGKVISGEDVVNL